MGLRWQDAPEGLAARLRGCGGRAALPARDAAVSGINAALLEATQHFHGGIARCHEAQQNSSARGDDQERPSPGPTGLITVVAQRHPHRTDDGFVRDNFHRWPS